MRRIIPAALLICAIALAACGEPTDRPEDCTGNEFFDQSTDLCTSCPVIDPPSCRPRFGFVIVSDPDTACPVAQCSDTPQCADFEIFETDSASCQPACPEGSTTDDAGTCVACPEAADPECADGELTCTSRSSTDGCPVVTCAASCD